MNFFQKNIISVFFTFSIGYFIILILAEEIFLLYGIGGFKASPYIKMISISFTSIYFIKYFLNLRIFLNARLHVMEESVLVFVWFLAGIPALIIGIVMSNPIIYIITDFLYILLGSLLFFVIIHLNEIYSKNLNVDFNQQVKFIKNVSILMSVLSIICIIAGINVPIILTIFILTLGFIFLVLKSYVFAFLLYSIVIVQIATANRAMLISIILCFFLSLFRLLGRKKSFARYIRIVYLSLAGILFSWLLLVLLIEVLPASSPLATRISQILVIMEKGVDYESPEMISFAQRIVEVNLVIDNWVKSPLYWPFSTGLGSVIDGKLLIDDSVTGSALLGASNVHNIHILPFALIHKYGFIGLIIFFLIAINWVKSFNNILSVRSESFSIIFLFSNVFFCLWVVFSLPASNFLWSMPIFWLCLALKSKKHEIS